MIQGCGLGFHSNVAGFDLRIVDLLVSRLIQVPVLVNQKCFHLCFFELLGQGWDDFEKVTHNPVGGDVEDRGIGIGIDGYDALSILHPHDVLNGSGDSASQIETRRDRLPRAADLAVPSEPLTIYNGTAVGDGNPDDRFRTRRQSPRARGLAECDALEYREIGCARGSRRDAQSASRSSGNLGFQPSPPSTSVPRKGGVKEAEAGPWRAPRSGCSGGLWSAFVAASSFSPYMIAWV